MSKKEKNAHAVALGRLGGSVSSPKKTEAARKNATKPRKRKRRTRPAESRGATK